ncbi:3-isopropylmalate dehydratase large subunit [Sporolituus thermophilus]|uniref:3-isopropylmalate dehydratase large subunit n=1 Tax=Sporolituus thermophilus DSM 23256 TaxID=1123285 RepID=A0A1G7HI06_9FIRM|nr:3-isopropylmalate dehydratase large subunit [Sporolituus thermophilus]SDF00112.1 3-isopropylmalate/(R)-2-methylmalate dehydratase large subunit [Sporolituus thermophilus DSM 23256]
MHAIEKILAKAAGKDHVTTGEIVNCKVDLAGINDLYLQTIRSFYEMGGKKVFDPGKIVIFLDHYAPASTIMQADNQKQFREFAWEQGIDKLMDVDQGVCHQVLADKGLVYPGMVLVVTDSHTTTHGAFGAFGTGVGATDLATIMITGHLWFRVPEIVRINLEGELPKGVYAKDIILKVIGTLGADYAVYKAVEFTGPVLKQLSVSERMALCNMTTEMGAKTSYIQPDEITLAYLKDRVKGDYEIFHTDPGYQYAAEHTFDVSDLKPQVAAPHSVDNVHDITEYIGRPVQQAFLGTCTGGRVQDLAVAAQILKGKKVHPRTRFIVVPASKAVFLEAMEKGYIQTLVEAGATFVTPGCAACLGTHQGMLASGETCITASSRNFPGRMGHTKAEIFIGSPAAVAAAALEGKIVDPAKYLD